MIIISGNHDQPQPSTTTMTHHKTLLLHKSLPYVQITTFQVSLVIDEDDVFAHFRLFTNALKFTILILLFLLNINTTLQRTTM